MRGSSARRWYRRCSPPRFCGHALTVRAFPTDVLPGNAGVPPASFHWREAVWHLRAPVLQALFQQISAPSRLHPARPRRSLGLDGRGARTVWTTPPSSPTSTKATPSRYFYEPFLEAFGPALHKTVGGLVHAGRSELSASMGANEAGRHWERPRKQSRPRSMRVSSRSYRSGCRLRSQRSAKAGPDWPALPELLPVSFPGVKTSRDGFLVDVDLERLKARVTEYFDKALSHKGNRVAVSECDEDHGAVRRAGRARDLAGAWRPERSRVHPIRVPPVRPSLALLGGGWRAA